MTTLQWLGFFMITVPIVIALVNIVASSDWGYGLLFLIGLVIGFLWLVVSFKLLLGAT